MNKQNKTNGYLNYLTISYIITLIITLLSYPRIVLIEGYLVSIALVIGVIPFAVLGLIAEVYGNLTAKHTIWMGVMTGILFAVFAMIIAKLPHPSFTKGYADSFNTVMQVLFLTTLVAIVVIFLLQWVHIYGMQKLNKFFAGKYFLLRHFISLLSVSIVILLVEFLLHFFNDQRDQHVALPIMITTFVYMVVGVLICALFTSAMIKWIRQTEKGECK